MIKLETDIEGKRAYYGEVCPILNREGFTLCGNWEYDRGKFDKKLWSEAGETIYIRLPFRVVEGMLDHHQAFIEFQNPYVIKHVVNTGLDWDESSLLTVAGLSQFQEPLDPDGHIERKNKWVQTGKTAVEEIVQMMNMYIH